MRNNVAAVPAVAAAIERSANQDSRDLEKTVMAKFLNGQEPAWKEKDSATAVLADWMTADDNPYFARATVDLLWTTFSVRASGADHGTGCRQRHRNLSGTPR